MLSMLRTRFGLPGAIAVLALVLAMVGGAYAAAKLNATQKKEVKKIAKQFAGKDGAQGLPGPAGPQGPAGASGKDGAAGKDGATGATGATGTAGATGKSVVAGTEAPSVHCPAGGSHFEVEGSGTLHYACNGEMGATGDTGPTGEPWTPNGTLPPGATEKGTWLAKETSEAAISFPIPLAAPIEHTVKLDEAAATGDTETGSTEIKNIVATAGTFDVGGTIEGAGIPAGTTIVSKSGKFTEANKGKLVITNAATATATGVSLSEPLTVPATCDNGSGEAASAANPEADPGFLCIFTLSGAYPNFVSGLTVGAFFAWTTEQTGSLGTFAVTAP